MRNHVRKYVLILLMVLTALLCTAGASTWILLSEKTVDAPKPFTPIATTVSGTITSTTAVYEGQNATVSGYTIKDANNVDVSEYFTATCSTVGLEGSADSVDGITVTATVSFTANTAFYSEPTNTATAQVKLKAVAYTRISSKNKFYSNVEDAVAGANAKTTSSASVVIIPNLMETDGATRHPLTINSALTLNSGVSMYLPYVDNSYNGKGTYDITEDEIKNTYAGKTTYADANDASVKTNRMTLVHLKDDLTVAQGASLYLGGQFGTIGVVGNYCELNLDENASINVSGNFYCYGYVKENADNAKNGNQTAYQNVYGNDYDSGRQVSVSDTGYLKTAIGVYDMKANASDLMSLNDNGVFPLTVFDFPNLQTYVEIVTGGSLISQTHLSVKAGSMVVAVNKEISIISSDTSTASVFYLNSENIGLEYCSTGAYTVRTNKTRVYLNGSVSQGEVGLNIDAVVMQVDITTADKFLPFSYKFNIFVNDGAEFTNSKYQVKFLPGSLLQNNKGGVLNITSDFIFYDKSEASKIISYPTSYDGARFINNGTLLVSSAGKIGALIETTATDTTATCDFSACTDANAFTVMSKEGETGVEITRVSNGYFKNSDKENELYQFVAGSTITSLGSDGCWSGEKYALRNLNVSIAETNYTVKLFSYQIFTANDAEGTGSTNATAEIDTATTVPIPEGKHVRVLVKRHESATLDGKALDTGMWYQVTDDMDLVITPSEGIKLSITTPTGDAASGNGTVKVWLSECTTKDENGDYVVNGVYDEIWNTTGGIGGTATTPPVSQGGHTSGKSWFYLVKGSYFMIKIQDGNSLTYKLDPENYTITRADGTSDRFYVDTGYKLDQECTVFFARKKGATISCFAEGTMIALADGTQKPIEEITSNDSILVFDHVSGEYVASGILYYEDSGKDYYDIINLEFSNGQKTRIIYEHGLFDLTLNKYVYITQNNYADLIGHEFALTDTENGYKSVTLEKAYITNELTGCYSITSFAFNYFIDGLFSMPGAIDGLFNIFEYGEGLKYDEEKMEADIEKYGLFTYEDFKELVPIEVFEAVTDAKYFKVAIGKGYITWDEIVEIIQKYLEF